MGTLARGAGRRLLTFIAVAALLGALGAAAAATATAAPSEPTLSLAGLRTMLAASPDGTVDAHFLTTVKGASIDSIPCSIEGIVPQAAADNGDLILFAASGPVIDQVGGIAAGMSGSPMYVDVGGVDTLVGAVSYGDVFTGNGLGLATPIEHMMTLETDFTIDPLAATNTRTVPLAQPVKTGGATVAKLLIAPTTRAARRLDPGPRETVMRPLAMLQVGGVPSGAPAFRELQQRLAAKGFDVKAGVAGGAAGAEPGFTTPLVPGSSVGELFMRGDTWWGGVGTTTYVTPDDELVAFGHPMMFDGTLSAYLTNADVISLWSSSYEPYKVVAPGAVRGAITVDSGPGIAGVIGELPAEVPFTVTAEYVPTGKVVSTTSYVTQWAADQFKYPYWDMNAISFWPALYQATGDQAFDGHIAYTLTIKLTDGVHEYTVTRDNVWEDSYDYDAPFLAVTELAALFTTLTADPDGTINPHLLSVDLDAQLTPQLDRARVVDVDVPGGVKTGINTVHVTFYRYGSTAPETADIPLTVPEGMSTKGTVYAKAPFTSVESMGDGSYGWWSMYGPNTAAPQTLADVVAGLEGLGNGNIVVAYDPPRSDSEDYYDFGEPWSSKAVIASRDMNGTYMTGAASKSQTDISIYQMSGPAVAGRTVMVGGYVGEGASEGDLVSIYTRDVDQASETLVTAVPLVKDPEDPESGSLTFVADVPVKKNTVVRAEWGGNAGYLVSSASTSMEVQARVSLSARVVSGRVTLKATVVAAQAGATPMGPGPLVRFERKAGGRWVTIPVKAHASATGATFSAVWRPKVGTYTVRAFFNGSSFNTPAASAGKKVVVK
jgi:hypothetical protein